MHDETTALYCVTRASIDICPFDPIFIGCGFIFIAQIWEWPVSQYHQPEKKDIS